MKPVLIAGITIVNLALISYSIAIISQTRNKVITRKILTFLTVGVIFDITATLCMVIGSSEGPVTLHGIIGYSSLAGMLTDTIFSYRNASKSGFNIKLSARFLNLSLLAYLYWIAAYITGAVIIMMRNA
ncbi:MAG: hypothetical protein AB9842_09230 [Bacteroidales bacterium]